MFGQSENGVYLVVVWAAVVCTAVGPLGVGLLVRRVKVLEKRRREGGGGGEGVLGVWGFESGGENVQGEKGKEVGEQTMS